MDQKTLCEIWREICEDIIQKAEEIVHMGVHFRVYDFFSLKGVPFEDVVMRTQMKSNSFWSKARK